MSDDDASAAEVHWARVPYRALAKLPEEQVKFLLTGARIWNDVLLLQRLLIALRNGLDTADIAERSVKLTAFFSLMTLLAGKLWEGSATILKFSRLWKGDSAIQLNDTGVASLADLKRRFANGSRLSIVRNNSAFHYDSEEVLDEELRAFQDLAATDEKIEWVAGGSLANTFYTFSSANHNLSILNAAYPGKPRQEQMNALYSDIVNAAGTMGRFLDSAIAALFTQSEVDVVNIISLEPIEMKGRPDIEDFDFPMLVNVPSGLLRS